MRADSYRSLAPPLSPGLRRKGRRLAIASHAVGQIHNLGVNGDLTTLALVALGAGEALVGSQRFLIFAVVLLQLPTLQQVGRHSKRSILVSGQVLAMLATLPLLAFGALVEADALGLWVAFGCFTLAAAGFSINQTVWFPMLHGFVAPAETGRFFGVLRTGWHLTLIPYFLGARAWLEAHPGQFAPVFGFALLCGLGRLLLIARLPERSERTGSSLDLRAALRFVRSREGWGAYVAGVTLSSSCRAVFLTFAVVMMRRDLGFSEGQVLYCTAAVFGGGLVSLYLWGRWVDRFGPLPLFRWTAFLQALTMVCFALLAGAGALSVPIAVAAFFSMSLLAAGFDVADTRVLFALTPAETPARLLVPTTVVKAVLGGALPLVAGFALEAAIGQGLERIAVYRGLFLLLCLGVVAGIGPLRRFQVLPGGEPEAS
jgi:Na+/melibiose symporter-like transporter